MGTLSLLLIASAAGSAASGGFLSGLVASTAGSAASSGLLGGLVTSAAGSAASGGLLSGLVTSATGSAASSRLLSGLVTSAAGSCGSSGLRLLVPAKEMRKCHNELPPNQVLSGLCPLCFLFYSEFPAAQVRTILLHSHLLVTFGEPELPLAILSVLHYNRNVTSEKRCCIC